MKDTLNTISEKISIHKKELQKNYFIREIGIFGSYVRGEEKENSDIDILVDIEKPIDLFKFLELEEALAELTCNK